MKKMHRVVSALVLLTFLTSFVRAQDAGVAAAPVVINEVAWAGSAASSNDEWIELYNTTDAPIDVAGWSIDDDDGTQNYVIAAGTIAAHGYFLIEDSEGATSVVSDAAANLSLTNSGDKLVLKNAAGAAVDTVNGSSGAWYFGSAEAKTSMERIVAAGGDVQENFGSATGASGATDRNDGVINGTPKAVNSVTPVAAPAPAPVPTPSATVILQTDSATPPRASQVHIGVNASGVQNLFSYGFELQYDPTVLAFIRAESGTFLGEAGLAATSFHAALENGTAGKIIVGDARVAENKTGVSGDGVLFTATFEVVGAAGTNSSVRVGSNSFLANVDRDVIATFTDANISVAVVVAQPVREAVIAPGAERYQIRLSWQAPTAGASSYKILRKMPNGIFAEIGTTQNIFLIDGDGIIPHLNYEYKVIAINGGQESAPVTITGQELRGVKGDNNRSDRVDGRDLQRLAQHFGEQSTAATFDALIDTTYDGIIDGSDLIDIGASWAVTYNSAP